MNEREKKAHTKPHNELHVVVIFRRAQNVRFETNVLGRFVFLLYFRFIVWKLLSTFWITFFYAILFIRRQQLNVEYRAKPKSNSRSKRQKRTRKKSEIVKKLKITKNIFTAPELE